MSEILNTLSQELAGLVKAASPSLVRVEARRRLPATGIVWSNDGYIVTSDHGVERQDGIKIGLDSGETVDADLVGRDPSTDIALLKVEAELTAAQWSPVDALNVGNLALALGRPGDNVLATMGVIGALDGEWQTRAGGKIDHYVQTDVVMYPGFSGGALVSADNQVLGMMSSGLARGMSLAVPFATLERVTTDLKEHGHIKRGFLGVGVQPVALPENIAEDLGQETGVMVVSVEPESPAAHAGIVLGDVIVHLDGEAVTHVDGLLMLLMGERVGKTVNVKVLRAGQLQDVDATVGEREAPAHEGGSRRGRRGRGRGPRGGGFRGRGMRRWR